MGKRKDYFRFVEAAVANSIAAFADALNSGDPIAVAMASIVDPAVEGTTAVERLQAFLSHDHGREVDTQLVLGIFAFCEEGDLTQAAEAALQDKARELPIGQDEAKLIDVAVRGDGPAARRASLHLWLHKHDLKAALATARTILEDAARPYDPVSRMAILVLGMRPGKSEWRVLVAYANRHLEKQISEGETPHDPQAALSVLNGVREIRDIQDVGSIMVRLAALGVPVGESLDRLFRRLSKDQLRELVGLLGTPGHGAWLAGQCLPGLLRARARDTAESAGWKQWPPECLTVLAGTHWEQFDAKLYPVAVRALHQRDDEAIRKQVRVQARAYCEALSEGDAVRQSIGSTCLQLCLSGVASLDDEDVLAILEALTAQELLGAIDKVAWKSAGRAEALGKLVAQINSPVLVELSKRRVAEQEQAVGALLEGAAGPQLDERAAELVSAVKSSQKALGTLAGLSESAAEAVLAVWTAENSMTAFRALAGSSRAEERLESIPAQVREYQLYSPDERRELLEAYADREDRGNVLLGILSDWAKTGKNRPQREDLTDSLYLLGDELAARMDVDEALPLLTDICQSPDILVRRAVYRALGRGRVTGALVDVLLERHQHEVPGVKNDVRGALDAVADNLDRLAGDPDVEDHGEATRLLARIHPARALPHARELLDAKRSQDRLIAAQILGQSGMPDTDAEILRQRAKESEPEAAVREEMVRAARRLEVGDTFDAHMRIGELVGIGDQAAWARLDPNEVWGRWVNLLVSGLNRLSKAEASGMWGEAVDALDEVAKTLFFRAIEVHGEEINLSQKVRTRVEVNKEDYGAILYTQHIISNWKWASYFGSLHNRRTAHLAKKGETEPVPEPTDSDLEFAYDLFRLGGATCCFLLTGLN